MMVAIALFAATSLFGPRLLQQQSTPPDESRMLLGTLGHQKSAAKWVSISGQQQDIAVLDFSGNDQNMKFKMPGFFLEPVLVGSTPCSRLRMPEHILLQTVGLPEVPVLSRSFQVPSGSKTTLKIVKHVTREMKVDPVEPSLGHLTRDVNPLGLIPEFDDFYQQKNVWPKNVIEMSKPFTLRELSGVNIRVNPLRYDAGKGLLLITEQLVVDIITENSDGQAKTITASWEPDEQEFTPVYQRIFGSYEPSPRTDKYQPLPHRGRMLIISHPAFVNDLSGFVTWKQMLGIDVTIRTTDQVGGTSAAIGAFISSMYKEDDGLTWVILVGDKAQMPTNVGSYDGSDSDSRYAMVDGDDIYPDLYVSRISATNSTELLTQLNKFIEYEKSPSTGPAAHWYQHGIGIASDEGSPPDYERAELLRTQMLNNGFNTVDQIYQGQGSSSLHITNAVNYGASLVNYLGHGSGTSWGSVYFSTSQVNALHNGPQWPWIVDVSCYNGDFSQNECLAEAWMRSGTPEAPQGAIGIISASSLAPWVPPTVMQAEVVDLLTGNEAFTLGSLYYSGLMKMLDEYSGIAVSEQVIDQNIVFGDCSLMVRTQPPGVFAVNGPVDLASTATSWTGNISGPAGSVAALTVNGQLWGLGFVGQDGVTQINWTETLEGSTQIQLTVSGFNMVPDISSLTLDGSDVSITPHPDEETPDSSVSAEVRLQGNFPNPFNPQTNIAFELPREMPVRLGVYDIRGHLVIQLFDGVLGSGRQTVSWNGTNSFGSNVSSGVYLYRLDTPDGTKTGRMTLSK